MRANVTYGTISCVTLLIAAVPAAADGFTPGHLVATDQRRIYTIDPATGTAQIIISGQSNLGDVVYNPVSDSLFVTLGGGTGSSTISEVTWDAVTGYEISPFLSGLDSVTSFAVDRTGWLYFNQDDFTNDQLWRADLMGNVFPVTESTFGFLFEPQFMNFSADESTLFITTSPSNNIEKVSLPSGDLSDLTDVSFPSGVDVAANGDVFVAHGFGDYLISRATPDGSLLTYLDESWMSQAAGDIEYDDESGNLYVLDRDLWVIDSNRDSKMLLSGDFLWYSGLDMITSTIPEPSTFGLLVLGLISLMLRRDSIGCNRMNRAGQGL